MRVMKLTLTAVLALTVTRAHAGTCQSTEADKAAVVDTLRTFYVGAKADDLRTLRRVTAPSFYAFDAGKRFDSVDALYGVLKDAHDKGVALVWNVTEPAVTIHCDQAWITYLNDGSVKTRDAAAPVPKQWLESAVLEKRAGQWLIVFFHSTSAEPPANKP